MSQSFTGSAPSGPARTAIAPPGLVLGHAAPADPSTAPQDPAEAAYWEMDARIKGYGEWKGRPQSERDAFKAVFRKYAGR